MFPALVPPSACSLNTASKSNAFDPVAEEGAEDVYGSIMNSINAESEDVYSQVMAADESIYAASGPQDKRSMVVRALL